MATTKRFTINQHWQQISTSNVTLIGCNTVATYHIFVGTDTPTGDSDYISDMLSQPTPYNFDTPVWVKLNVTNQLDEADMIAIGELAQPSNTTVPEVIPPSSQEPAPVVPPAFDNLINCHYQNGILSIIDPNVPFRDYYAISLQHRSVTLTAQAGFTRILFSRADSFETREVFDTKCIGFGFTGYGSEGFFDDVDNNNRQTTDMVINAGDELLINIQDGAIKVTNTTKGTYCTSEVFPNYMQISALAIVNYDASQIPVILK